MAAEQRKLLEQLMGASTLSSQPGSYQQPQLSITDPKVCRSYLAGTCPHDLFTNTKQDMGPCPRAHVEKLKLAYADAPEAQRAQWGFAFDHLRDLAKYVSECDRRIESAQRRLEKTPDELRQAGTLLRAVVELGAGLDAAMAEVRVLCELGAVNTAVLEYSRLRGARAQKDERERELKILSDSSGPSGHQKLQVCDVCGAYLSRLDNDRRLADHFFGKMHLGYAAMRRTCEVLQRELKGRVPPVREEVGLDGPRGGGWGDEGFGGGRGGGLGRGGGGRGGGHRGRGGFGPRY